MAGTPKTPGLRYGSGYRTGPDAYVNQQESLSTRMDSEPRKTGWIIEAERTGATIVEWTPTVTDTLTLQRCAMVPYDTPVVEARIRVQATAASELRAAIYVWAPRDRRFVMVPGTLVHFPVSVAGQITAILPGEVSLQAGVQYFIGTVALKTFGAATVGCLSMGAGIDNLERVRQMAGVLIPPATVALSATTLVSDCRNLPHVVYFSVVAAEVT